MMKPIRAIVLSLLLVMFLVALRSEPGLALDRTARQHILHASVQIVALNFEESGPPTLAWTGSGTIIDPTGLILTNYHVVEENGDWNRLGVSITTSSDQPPQAAYFAEIVSKAPRLDLAVIRVVSDLDGNPVDPATLNLPYLPLGDATTLEVGDELEVFGYPGIGGETITFTQGRVSGFASEEGVDFQRAWIKTDATIAGGNSGGTAVDATGVLVGVPTKLGAGNTDYFADVRPIQDTNGDGVVDENDTPISLGGFLNSLRPINLAYPLIEAARNGEQVEATPGQALPSQGEPAPAPSGGTPTFGSITFASQQDADGAPLDPGSSFPATTPELLAYFDYQGMADGMEFNYVWTIDGVTAVSQSLDWNSGSQGTFQLSLNNGGEPLPPGKYDLVLGVAGELLQQGSVVIGQATEPTLPEPVAPEDGVTLYGTIVDVDTGEPIPSAFFFILNPGVSVDAFMATDETDGMVAAIGITDENGAYETFPALPRGTIYGVVVYAGGYEILSVDDALEILPEDSAEVEMEPIALVSE